MVDSGIAAQDDGIIIDWDRLLVNIPDDFAFFDEPAGAGGSSISPDSGCSLSIDDVEQYLMLDESDHQDQNDVVIPDDFFSDVLLLDSSSPESGGSDRCKDSASPESVAIVTDEEEEQKKRENGADVSEAKENDVVDNDDDDDDGNPVAKKRKRQMRNRDAAVRSRERKKMYVKDLEIKSKYYESECKRLGIMLQCCLAENQALRLSLHNSKAFDVSMSKQESAVLLLESLLLGSLLGFVGIIYLLILPSQLLSILEMGLVGNVDNVEWASLAPRKTGSKVFGVVLFHSFMMGKRCKASRSRMKLRLSTTQVVV